MVNTYALKKTLIQLATPYFILNSVISLLHPVLRFTPGVCELVSDDCTLDFVSQTLYQQKYNVSGKNNIINKYTNSKISFLGGGGGGQRPLCPLGSQNSKVYIKKWTKVEILLRLDLFCFFGHRFFSKFIYFEMFDKKHVMLFLKEKFSKISESFFRLP